MMPEIGTLLLALAVVLSFGVSVAGLLLHELAENLRLALIRNQVIGVAAALASAFGILVYALVSHDFSVAYVANNSNTELPLLYCVAAAWGAHEGSLLLWALLLSIWSVLVCAFSRSLPSAVRIKVLGVLGLVELGFLLFTLLTSSPFLRNLQVPEQGADLNPILQDPALALHPPLLYMGYVGTAVAFAFAIAAMLTNHLDSQFARWVRPWTLASWLSLTLGITLGSFWAYYELGWGGWWFWDPVENASFMPWLAATALIHSLAVTEKRGLFRQWTLLLAILTFSLSLLGTFLVRSGVLVSVHAFAADPARGLFILGLLLFYIVGALVIYAIKARHLQQRGGFLATSRETFLLINNALLVSTTALILLGTLWPLVLDVFKLGQISVGPPYFNLAFMIPMLPLVFLAAIGMHATWRYGNLARRRRFFLASISVALLGAGVLVGVVYHQGWHWLTVVGFTAGIFIIVSSAYEPCKHWLTGQRLGLSVYGMVFAHIGMGIFTIGVSGVSSFALEKDVSLAKGESAVIGEYQFALTETRAVNGPNYAALAGIFALSHQGQPLASLQTEKRVFHAGGAPLTHAAIYSQGTLDLFVALGEDLGAGKWSLRLQYKPLVRFIWWGGVMMALGAILALMDRRYRTVAPASPDA